MDIDYTSSDRSEESEHSNEYSPSQEDDHFDELIPDVEEPEEQPAHVTTIPSNNQSSEYAGRMCKLRFYLNSIEYPRVVAETQFTSRTVTVNGVEQTLRQISGSVDVERYIYDLSSTWVDIVNDLIAKTIYSSGDALIVTSVDGSRRISVGRGVLVRDPIGKYEDFFVEYTDENPVITRVDIYRRTTAATLSPYVAYPYVTRYMRDVSDEPEKTQNDRVLQEQFIETNSEGKTLVFLNPLAGGAPIFFSVPTRDLERIARTATSQYIKRVPRNPGENFQNYARGKPVLSWGQNEAYEWFYRLDRENHARLMDMVQNSTVYESDLQFNTEVRDVYTGTEKMIARIQRYEDGDPDTIVYWNQNDRFYAKRVGSIVPYLYREFQLNRLLLSEDDIFRIVLWYYGIDDKMEVLNLVLDPFKAHEQFNRLINLINEYEDPEEPELWGTRPALGYIEFIIFVINDAITVGAVDEIVGKLFQKFYGFLEPTITAPPRQLFIELERRFPDNDNVRRALRRSYGELMRKIWTFTENYTRPMLGRWLASPEALIPLENENFGTPVVMNNKSYENLYAIVVDKVIAIRKTRNREGMPDLMIYIARFPLIIMEIVNHANTNVDGKFMSNLIDTMNRVHMITDETQPSDILHEDTIDMILSGKDPSFIPLENQMDILYERAGIPRIYPGDKTVSEYVLSFLNNGAYRIIAIQFMFSLDPDKLDPSILDSPDFLTAISDPRFYLPVESFGMNLQNIIDRRVKEVNRHLRNRRLSNALVENILEREGMENICFALAYTPALVDFRAIRPSNRIFQSMRGLLTVGQNWDMELILEMEFALESFLPYNPTVYEFYRMHPKALIFIENEIDRFQALALRLDFMRPVVSELDNTNPPLIVYLLKTFKEAGKEKYLKYILEVPIRGVSGPKDGILDIDLNFVVDFTTTEQSPRVSTKRKLVHVRKNLGDLIEEYMPRVSHYLMRYVVPNDAEDLPALTSAFINPTPEDPNPSIPLYPTDMMSSLIDVNLGELRVLVSELPRYTPAPHYEGSVNSFINQKIVYSGIVLSSFMKLRGIHGLFDLITSHNVMVMRWFIAGSPDMYRDYQRLSAVAESMAHHFQSLPARWDDLNLYMNDSFKSLLENHFLFI